MIRAAPVALAVLLSSQPHLTFAREAAAQPPAKEPDTEEQTALPPPSCPEGSTSPEVFERWYRRAMQLSAEAFAAQYGHRPAKDEVLPLLPVQLETNLRILCNCVRCRAGTGPEDEHQPSPTAAGSCNPSATALCIDSRRPGDRRFEVRVAFRAVPDGRSCGDGQVRLDAHRGFVRGGSFWCSEPEKPEFLIKLLDSCTVNGHIWVVWSAARGVELTATVKDTRTGETSIYVVRNGVPGTDRKAFACDASEDSGSMR